MIVGDLNYKRLEEGLQKKTNEKKETDHNIICDRCLGVKKPGQEKQKPVSA